MRVRSDKVGSIALTRESVEFYGLVNGQVMNSQQATLLALVAHDQLPEALRFLTSISDGS